MLAKLAILGAAISANAQTCNVTDQSLYTELTTLDGGVDFTRFGDVIITYVTPCIFSGLECVTNAIVQNEGYSPPCAECFGTQGFCVASSCFTYCSGGYNENCAYCVSHCKLTHTSCALAKGHLTAVCFWVDRRTRIVRLDSKTAHS